ncbi:family 2A encapsulin nanocompartment cargo protein cysteine desulfurase [Burkholderia sp. 4M9327F10]|jgi:cysteine desulfurase/selenocysteine lyase|uniref:family 2A encapsulin nanocompartment cargo protein cysteine desulfurase n=2 Tax=Burkholderiaceae TaxID=119060 RepID=UPI0010F7C46B
MNMTTPTSSSPAAYPDPTSALPAGLPDPATLTRLANEFFATPPGSTPAGNGVPGSAPSEFAAAAPAVPASTNPVPPGSPMAGPSGAGSGIPGAALPQGKVPGANLAPSAPTHVLSLGNRAPALLPHAAAQNGLPDNLVTVAPGLDSRYGGTVLGVPEAAAANAPVDAAPGRSSASPYYFMDPARSLTHGGGAAPLPTVSLLDPLSVPSLLPAAEPAQVGSLQGSPFGLPRGFSDTAPAQPESVERYFLADIRAPGAPAASRASGPAAQAQSGHPQFDVNAIRRDFPILQERVNGRQLVWFDNAATTQKPQSVIDRLSYFYLHENSNIHRAAHALAGRATDAYEAARSKVQRFINASQPEEIVFVRGTTEAINLIAKSWGVQNVGAGDEIIVSHLEHHANIVPWQQLASLTGATLRVIPVDDSGQVLLEEYSRLLNDKTKIVSVTQVSNALGTVVPVKEIVEMAHRVGAVALIDGAQSVSHMRVDVQAMDADFFVFSGHKVFGPTGIGAVYGKRELLDAMPPWQGGGNMISDVTFERTVFQPAPHRFEAGTGNIADAVGLGAALDYVTRVGIENIARYEHELLDYATALMKPIPGVRLIGTAQDKASVLSFVLNGYTPEEVGRALSEEGIAVRAGHHCAQPILRRFGLEATVRPSLAFYNTPEEVDRMIAVVKQLAIH